VDSVTERMNEEFVNEGSSSHHQTKANDTSIEVEDDAMAFNLDMVVGLRGEFANHIGVLAYSKIMQIVAQQEVNPPLQFTFRYKSQGLEKSFRARQDIEQCFRSFNPNNNQVNLKEFDAANESSVYYSLLENQTRSIRRLDNKMEWNDQ